MNAPGLIRFLGPPPGPKTLVEVALVVANSTRGSRNLVISDTSRISQGSWITLTLAPDLGNLMFRDINMRPTFWTGCATCTNPVSGNGAIGEMGLLRFHSRVNSISGNVLTLERPLPFNVSTIWAPKIYNQLKGITEVGIQDLTLQMKWSR